MFGIGFTELVLILVVALIVVGPERLPELGQQLGRIVRDLRRMYGNLRAELGPEFDDIERGIRDLRALDPRQQLRDYSRNLLDDLSADAPELKQMATAPKLDLERLGRDVLHDDLLDKPLAETRKADGPVAPALEQPASSLGEQDPRPPVTAPLAAPRTVETTWNYE